MTLQEIVDDFIDSTNAFHACSNANVTDGMMHCQQLEDADLFGFSISKSYEEYTKKTGQEDFNITGKIKSDVNWYNPSATSFMCEAYKISTSDISRCNVHLRSQNNLDSKLDTVLSHNLNYILIKKTLHNLRANAFRKRLNFEAAINEYTLSLYCKDDSFSDKNDIPVYESRAWCYIQLNHIHSAFKDYEMVLIIDKNHELDSFALHQIKKHSYVIQSSILENILEATNDEDESRHKPIETDDNNTKNDQSLLALVEESYYKSKSHRKRERKESSSSDKLKPKKHRRKRSKKNK